MFLYKCLFVHILYRFITATKTEHTFASNKTCTDYAATFGLLVADYTECSILFARPIRFCEQCSSQYIDAVSAYKIILASSDDNGACRSRWIDQDTLQLVQTTYEYVVSVWNKGHCSKCYDWPNNNQTLSNNTLTFINYVNKTNECIGKWNSTEYDVKNINGISVRQKQVCIKCKDDYLKLNNFYESMKTEDDNICMDIVDMMNDTRCIWSDELECWKRETHFEALFYCATALTALLPIIFYATVRFIGKP